MTSQFLIYESPLQILPTLAQEIGLHESIVLQQVHYWLNTEFSRCRFDDRYWVRYTPQTWKRQFAFWEEQTLKRPVRRLERLGILIGTTRGPDKTRYYTIDYETLGQIVSAITWRPEEAAMTVTHPARFPDSHFLEFRKDITDDDAASS